MRFQNRANFLAEEFIQAIGKYQDADHPAFKKSEFRNNYYKDVYLALLISQKGICAYTEDAILLDYTDIAKNFANGKYQGPIENTSGIDADIEHFNSELKKKKGWQLDNLFLARKFINLRKHRQPSEFLKPCSMEYAPEKFLYYEYLDHKFYPKLELPDYTNHDDIKNSIEILGINCPTVVSNRKNHLKALKQKIEWNPENMVQLIEENNFIFPTAIKFSMNQLTVTPK